MPDRHIVTAAAALLLATLHPATPVDAGGASDWSADHASRARLVAGPVEADGARWAGVEIAMDAGYKTYWRTPGDSGIPPELDWSASTNVADIEVEWPAPERFEDAFGAYFGYLEHVVWPVRVIPEDPGAPVVLALDLLYGVCKDICIPAQGSAALELPAEPIASDPTVVRAREAVPVAVAAGEAHAGLAIHGVEPRDAHTLAVRVEAPAGARLFAEGPDHSWFLAPQAEMGPDGTFAVEIAHAPRDAQGPVPVRLTLVADGAAIETLVEVER